MPYTAVMSLSPRTGSANGPDKPAARTAAPLWRWLQLLRRFILVAVLLVAAIQAWFLARVVIMAYADPASTAFMDSERDRLAAQKPPISIRRVWVPYAAIAPVMKLAVIASEDARFMAHWGVDWGAVRAAFRTNERRGRIALGGSTISMQLAKNMFLSPDRSYWRKGQEIVIAHMMEAVLGKRRILEIYLNSVEWGVGVFGVEAAAKHYFNKSAAQLSAREAAWLAAILPAPKRYDRQRTSQFLNRKTAIVLRRMSASNYPK